MKKELRLASQRYRLLKWHEDAGEDVTIRTFVDQESALAFLRKLAVNPSNLGVLRAVVAEHRSLQTTRGEGGKQVLFYQTDLVLTDIETNEKIWLGQEKIKKFVERKRTAL